LDMLGLFSEHGLFNLTKGEDIVKEHWPCSWGKSRWTKHV
jgi:hypothetical protein